MTARQAFSHESLTEASTTATTWPTKTTFTFTPDASSDYFIFFSALFANSSATANHYGEVSVYHDQAPVSVAYFATRSQEISSPQDYFSVFCVHKSSFGASPGAQDCIVGFNSSHAGDATKIKDVRMLAIKADPADKFAASDASSPGTGNTFQTKTTLTFTPATAGDYLLLVSAAVTHETTGGTTATRLNHVTASTLYGGQTVYHKNAWNYNCWTTGAKISLTAVGNTFRVEYSSPANTAHDIEQARVLALRLDKFDNAYVAQDFTGGNTTSASDAEFLTLTQTPLALQHATLAVGSFNPASTTVSGYFNMAKDGANITETNREASNAASHYYAGLAQKATLANTSTSWKWRARAETAGTTVTIDDLLIAVLQLEATPSSTVTGTASFDAAVRKALSAQASADAGVQATATAPTTADAAVRKLQTAVASASPAVRATLTTNTAAGAAVQRALSLAASCNAAAQVLASAQAQLDGAVLAAVTAGIGGEAAVQRAFFAAASLDAAVQVLRNAAAGLDTVVHAALAATTSADVYVIAEAGRQVLAALDAAVQAVRSAAGSLDGVVAVLRSKSLGGDAAVLVSASQLSMFDAVLLAARSAAVPLDTAVAAFHTATLGGDIAVQISPSQPSSLDTVVLASLVAGLAAEVVVAQVLAFVASLDCAVARGIGVETGFDAVIIGGGAGALIDLVGTRPPLLSLAGAQALANRLDGLRIAVTRVSGRGLRS